MFGPEPEGEAAGQFEGRKGLVGDAWFLREDIAVERHARQRVLDIKNDEICLGHVVSSLLRGIAG
ncbi:hypothetical protein D9M70_611980 [compost metagenome]